MVVSKAVLGLMNLAKTQLQLCCLDLLNGYKIFTVPRWPSKQGCLLVVHFAMCWLSVLGSADAHASPPLQQGHHDKCNKYRQSPATNLQDAHACLTPQLEHRNKCNQYRQAPITNFQLTTCGMVRRRAFKPTWSELIRKGIVVGCWF